MSTTPAATADVRRTVPTPAAPTGDAEATVRRLGATALVVAPLMMVAGAAVLFGGGVEYDAAVQAGTVGEILPDITAARVPMTITFSLWLAAMPVFALAARCIESHDISPVARRVVAALMPLAAALAAVAFGAFLVVVNVVAPAGDAVLAHTMLWLASTVDWVATVLLVGLPMVVVLRTDADGVFPGWLRNLAWVLLAASVLTVVSLATGTGLATWGFLVVPVGIVTCVSVGVVLRRRG